MRKVYRKRSTGIIKYCALSVLLLSEAVHGDVLGALNVARHSGCPSAAGPAKLQIDKKLSRAATWVASGTKPHDAAQAVGYAATQLASIHLHGFRDDRALQKVLAQRYCEIIGDVNIHDVGFSQRGDELWILLGASRGDPGRPANASSQVLSLVNRARSYANVTQGSPPRPAQGRGRRAPGMRYDGGL